jgi:hypothetical protein
MLLMSARLLCVIVTGVALMCTGAGGARCSPAGLRLHSIRLASLQVQCMLSLTYCWFYGDVEQ